MRVLFATRGSAGHLGPLVPFAHACRRAGHEVVVAAQRGHQKHVERAGLAFAPVGDPPAEEWMPELERYATLDRETAHAEMVSRFFAGVDLRAELPALRALVERRRPDLLVRESWEFGSTLVSDLYGIPIVRVGLGLAVVEDQTIDLAAPAVDQARTRLGLGPDPAGDRMRETPYFTTIPEELDDPAAEAAGRARRFRFEAAETTQPLPDWWEGNTDPLVYLTFGSVAAGSHLAYFPELYRAAIDVLATLPVRLLVTTGDASREIEELGEVPPNVHVETWVRHDDVASEAAAIIGHGGYGTTLGALAHGLPQVVLPLFSADQWANGAAVHRAGAGLCLGGDQKRPVLALPGADVIGELGTATTRVIEDGSYRRRAVHIAGSMRSLPPVDTAVDVLVAIARKGVTPPGRRD